MASRQPDGPTGIPFIGPFDAIAKGPLTFLSEIADQYGDVVFFREGPFRNVYLFSHPDHIEELLVHQHKKLHKDRVTRKLRRSLGEGLLTSEDEHWRRQRKLAAPSFTPAQIAMYGDQMVSLTTEAIEHWEHGEERDVHQDMMSLTLNIISEVLFSSSATQEVREVVAESLEVILTEFDRDVHTWRILLPEWFPTAGRQKMDAATLRLQTVFGTLIAQGRERAHPGTDLLGKLLVMQDEAGEGMSDEELREELLTLFLAGHETTALALFYTLFLLTRNPDAARQAHQEVDQVLCGRAPTVDDMHDLPMIRAVLNESMRLYPPAWIIGREARVPLEVDGIAIQPGDQILMSPWVVHKDPRWWEDPLMFRPGRWLEESERLRFAHFPFGGGPRVCIGNHFAMMEAVLILSTLLQRVRFVPMQEGAPDLTPSITLRPTSHTRMQVQLVDATRVRD